MRIFFTILLIYFFYSSATSQVAHAGPWTAYLDGNGIYGMALRDSFMYIQTANGLAFFNTNTRESRFFCDFNNPDIPLSTFGKTATIDQKGNFWCVYNNQLLRIRPDGTVQVMAPKPLYQINVMEADRNGQIWVGMVTAHLNNPAVSTCLAKFNGSGWDYVSIGVTRMNVDDLKFDDLNRPVVATSSNYNPDGLYRYDGSSFLHINGFTVNNIAVSSDGQVATAGTGYNGTVLKVYKNSSWTTYWQPGASDQIEFAYPVFDANNTLWSVNERAKVFRLNNAGLMQTLNPPINFQTGEKNDVVSGLALDDKGRLWLAKHSGLFLAADPNVDQWEFIQTAPMLMYHEPTSFYGYNDTILLCNSKGVMRIVENTVENLNWQGPIPKGFLRDYHRNGLWIYSGSKMTLYRDADTTVFDLAPMFPEPFYSDIKRLLEDAEGNIWIMNTRTMIRYTLDGQWSHFDVGKDLPPYNIYSCALAGKDMWVFLKGLHINHPTITQPGAHLIKIAGANITDSGLTYDFLNPMLSFAPVSDSNLWFTTAGDNRVLHLQNGDIKEYTQQDVGGPLNAQWVASYNDSTLLLLSNSGLFIFYRDKWYYPQVPSNRFSNSDAYRYVIGEDRKIYLGRYPLTVLEDVPQLLSTLSGTDDPIPDPATPIKLVYPNPTNDLLHVERLLLYCPDCSLKVSSLDGKYVTVFPAPLQSPLSLRALHTGAYVLSLQADGKTVESFVVVKE